MDNRIISFLDPLPQTSEMLSGTISNPPYLLVLRPFLLTTLTFINHWAHCHISLPLLPQPLYGLVWSYAVLLFLIFFVFFSLVQITGLEADTAFMFRSALYPCVVSFTVKAREGPRPIVGFGGAGVGGEDNDEVSGGNGQRGSGGSIRSSSLGGDEGSVLGGKDVTQAGPGGMAGSGSGWLGQGKIKEGIYKVIIKSGDDLRQDQLIMQMISLMDTLLKRVNLDLRCEGTVCGAVASAPHSHHARRSCFEYFFSLKHRLRPYAILATGPKDGLVQFVSDSLPVSRVLATHNGSILE
ncbi:unnamed protein product [Choristocarpus tenellus]